MKLNRSTSHAIRILIDCAGAGDGLAKVADLSDRLGITQQNVFKIVHILTRAELLVATRGRHGGVRLSRPAAEIRVGDIVRAMESTDLELESDGTSSADRRISADVNRVLDSALEAFISILDRHTLADLAGGDAGPLATVAPTSPPKRKATRAARGSSVRAEIRRG